MQRICSCYSAYHSKWHRARLSVGPPLPEGIHPLLPGQRGHAPSAFPYLVGSRQQAFSVAAPALPWNPEDSCPPRLLESLEDLFSQALSCSEAGAQYSCLWGCRVLWFKIVPRLILMMHWFKREVSFDCCFIKICRLELLCSCPETVFSQQGVNN